MAIDADSTPCRATAREGLESKKKRATEDSDSEDDLFPSIQAWRSSEERQIDLKARLNLRTHAESQTAAHLLAEASDVLFPLGPHYIMKGKAPLHQLVRPFSQAAMSSQNIFPDGGVFLSDYQDLDCTSPTLLPSTALSSQTSRRSKRPLTASQGNNEPRVTVAEMKAREQEQLKARELQIEPNIRRRLAVRPSSSRVATGQESFRHMPTSGCGWRTARDTKTDRRLYFPLRSKARGTLAADPEGVAVAAQEASHLAGGGGGGGM
ncbi:hypothetical protein HK405_009722 [Cladochytrium tenue]|nr:hypothetical protein HK405_009722 [Cladochytrium tenue]